MHHSSRFTMTAVALCIAFYAQSAAAVNERQNYTIEMASPESLQPAAPHALEQASAPMPRTTAAPSMAAAPAPAPQPRQAMNAPAPMPETTRPSQSSYESSRQLRVSSGMSGNTPYIQSVEPYTSRLPEDSFSIPINGAYSDRNELVAQRTITPATPSTVVHSEENYAAMSPEQGISPAATSTNSVASGIDPQATVGLNPTIAQNDGERIQEVTVPLSSTMDAAIISGFKSLQNSITLGLGQNTTLPLSIVGSALRGYSIEGNNIILRFSLEAAERIMHEQGNNAWIGLSNPVLVWLTVHDSTKNEKAHQLISGQNLDQFSQNLLNDAPTYKYRFMFPLLDLEEIQKVTVDTVLTHQNKVLQKATERYGADYFIAASMDTTADGVSFTWNLFNKDGSTLASSSLNGSLDEVASLSTGDIARALMNAQNQSQTTSEAIAAFGSADIDIDTLGQGDGFIRMKIANIHNLHDLALLRNTFITYGFAGDLRIIGYNSGTVVVEILTNSDATNFEGTISHSGDFVLLAPWTYSLKNAQAPRPAFRSEIGPSDPSRPNTRPSDFERQFRAEQASHPIGGIELNQPAVRGSLN